VPGLRRAGTGTGTGQQDRCEVSVLRMPMARGGWRSSKSAWIPTASAAEGGSRQRRAPLHSRQFAGRSQAPWHRGTDNVAMTVFYWVMGVLIVGTFVPSVLYMVLYAVTGEDGCLRRARGLWNYTRLLSLLGGNILIWGHVLVGLWRIWFR
jgi:hypothetical protein